MFGSKLRSWMEAVRPKKKQQRKDKKTTPKSALKDSQTVNSLKSSQNDLLDCVKGKSVKVVPNHAQTGLQSQTPRYSGANLSSPESAYSTGYSTDGTSPGAPPEYYINIRTGTRYVPSATQLEKQPGLGHISQCLKPNSPVPAPSSRAKTSSRVNLSPTLRERERLSTVAVHHNGERTTVSMTQDASDERARTSVTLHNTSTRLTEVVVNSSITSPRQRNRIRTNPWLPGSNLSPGSSCTGLHTRQDQITTKPSSTVNKTGPVAYTSPTVLRSPLGRPKRRNSLSSTSSSSCSSLSGASLHWDPTVVACRPTTNVSGSEEDDCTLNEMMGKYDESYVYEKETDILSDSDPTDCETDIDTGQDGGDEDDPCDFDFIDNGSHAEFCVEGKENTGHCTYHNFEMCRKASRRTKRAHKHASEKRKRCSSRKRTKDRSNPQVHAQLDGSRSAGATPLCVRRTNLPVSKLTGDNLKRRSNSVSFSQSPVNTFDKRDKEADKKYKELIVEAEHILMSMKTNGLSPRRIPGPPNKRVEILRSTESSKPEVFVKNRLTDDAATHLLRIPSNSFNSPRFSPKKNHITNFISHNTPVVVRRGSDTPYTKSSNNTPLLPRHKNQSRNDPRKSPKYRKKPPKETRAESSSSDDTETTYKSKHSRSGSDYCCPQSEPVKRKVYHKAVAFNLNYESSYNAEIPAEAAENARQQMLANTIANLKRSLEDQSASLKQVYKGSQHL